MNSIKTNFDFDQIKIFLCVPQCFVKTVKINKNSQIACLMKNDEYQYIFNGNIINPKSTFKEIGVINGNIFVAFKQNQKKEKISYDQWIKLSNDSSFELKLHSLANKRTKTEYFRLKDFRNMKIEGSLNLYRKMVHKLYLKKMKKLDDPINFDFEMNYEPSPVPCTDALPILW